MVLHDNHSDRSMLISLILARFVLVLLLNRNHLFHLTSLLGNVQPLQQTSCSL